MVVLSGPINNMRSMITGRYRIKESDDDWRASHTAAAAALHPPQAPARPRRRAPGRAALRLRRDSAPRRSLSILDKAEALTKAVQRALLAPRTGARARISASRDHPHLQAQRLDRSRRSRLCRAARRRLRRLEARDRRPRRKADEALARRPARAAVALADHPARLRRGLELHRPMEGRPACPPSSPPRGSSREARYIAFFCADTLEQTLDGTGRYYETIDLIDAFHPADHPGLRDELRAAQGRARRAAEAEGRAPARLQDGQVCDAHRGDRQLRQNLGAAAAASGRTAATNGTRGLIDDRAVGRCIDVRPPSGVAFRTLPPPPETRRANRAAARRSAQTGRGRERSRSGGSRRRSRRRSAASSRRAPSRKKAGSGNRRSRHGAPASALTARPTCGETKARPSVAPVAAQRLRSSRNPHSARIWVSNRATSSRGERAVVKSVGDQAQRLVHPLVGIALGQEPDQLGEIIEPGERQRARHQAPGPQRQGLGGIGAEMLVEPRPPDEADGVAGLQHRAEPRRAPAAHEAEMAAMRRVIASTIADCSPCLRTPMMRPSSRHSIASAFYSGAAHWCSESAGPRTARAQVGRPVHRPRSSPADNDADETGTSHRVARS